MAPLTILSCLYKHPFTNTNKIFGTHILYKHCRTIREQRFDRYFSPSDVKTSGTKGQIWCDSIMTYSMSERLMILLTTNMRLFRRVGSFSRLLCVKAIFSGDRMSTESGTITTFRTNGSLLNESRGLRECRRHSSEQGNTMPSNLARRAEAKIIYNRTRRHAVFAV